MLMKFFLNLLFFVIFFAFAAITLAKLVSVCKSVVCEIFSNVFDASIKCDCCFVSVKKHYSSGNVLGNFKSCWNSFPRTVFLKTRFLFLFTNLCKILLFFTIILVTTIISDTVNLKTFAKVTHPIITIFYLRAATETR